MIQPEAAKDTEHGTPVGFVIRPPETARADLSNLIAAKVGWIASMSDDELRAELIADGCDPDVDVEKVRVSFLWAASNALWAASNAKRAELFAEFTQDKEATRGR